MVSHYYTIGSVLDLIAQHPEPEERQNLLVPVSHSPASLPGNADDGFVITSTPPHIMDLDNPGTAHELAQMMKDTPLYHFNMELVLDEALSARHNNNVVRDALEKAFAGQALPQTMPLPDSPMENLSGSLRHPMLEHMDTLTLAKVYLSFLKNLRRHHEEFGFQRNILGKHADPFLSQFDGFVSATQGQVRADFLLSFGLRLDHDPHKPLESYVHSGQMQAMKMRANDPYEIALAWLECDQYQSRRCADIDRVMKVKGLPRQPNWVRIDMFRFLEKEAMKQHFAELLAGIDPDLKIAGGLPHLKRALRANAAGQIEESMQQLLSQVLNADTAYAGAAARFHEGAAQRQKESNRLGSAS